MRGLLVLVLLACRDDGPAAGPADLDPALVAAALELSPLPPVPADPTNAVELDPAAAWLGRWLYFDPRLSGSGEFSCATCHDPALGFGDGRPFSEAAGTTDRHAPTVLNAAYNDFLFWDGRADSLWAQALGPVEAAHEMDGDRVAVARLVAEDEALRTAWEEVFGPLPEALPAGEPEDAQEQAAVDLVFSSAGKAIAAYERLLVRGDAPFDRWVAGLREGKDNGLMSEEALEGFALFLGEGNCHFCHSGPTFTNGAFHNVGLAPVEGQRSDDLGRYDGIALLLEDPFNGAGAYSDDPEAGAGVLDYLVQGEEQVGQFKVPTLRNVADTAPYMRAGQLATLDEVVGFYSRLDQEPRWGHREDLLVPLDWGDDQVAAVVAFLESLTGAPLDPELTLPPETPMAPASAQSQ